MKRCCLFSAFAFIYLILSTLEQNRREISVKHCVFLSCLTIIRRSLVITYHRISVYIVRHSWKKLIDLKQEDHRSATRLRAISPFTPASDERENQEDLEITIAREATSVKDEGESEIKRKKKPLSQRKPVKDSELGWVSKATRNIKAKRGTLKQYKYKRGKGEPSILSKYPRLSKSFKL